MSQKVIMPKGITINVEDPIRTNFCGYEISPCVIRVNNDGPYTERPQPGEKPEFWGIYGREHQEDGTHLPMNVADAETLELAQSAMKGLSMALAITKMIFGNE